MRMVQDYRTQMLFVSYACRSTCNVAIVLLCRFKPGRYVRALQCVSLARQNYIIQNSFSSVLPDRVGHK